MPARLDQEPGVFFQVLPFATISCVCGPSKPARITLKPSRSSTRSPYRVSRPSQGQLISSIKKPTTFYLRFFVFCAKSVVERQSSRLDCRFLFHWISCCIISALL